MFREPYIRDNEKLRVKESLFMEIQNKLTQEQEKELRRNRFVRFGAVAAAALLVAGGVLGAVLAGGRSAPADAPEALQSVSAEDVGDYDALYALISSAGGARYALDGGMTDIAVAAEAPMGDTPMAEAPMAAEPMEESAAADTAVTAEAGAGTVCDDGSFSTTNVQVSGVDEADIVKTDGEYIYYIAENTLYIAKAAGRDTRVLSRTPLDGGDKVFRQAQEMFLLGDRLMILSQGWQTVWIAREGSGYDSGRDSTQISIYELGDRRAPKLTATLGQSGGYVSSRLIGDYVYLVTTQYIYDAVRDAPATFVPLTSAADTESLLAPGDIYCFGEPEQSAYTVVGSINLKTGSAHESAKAVLGSTGTIYANAAHLLVAQNDYQQSISPIAPDANGKNVQITRSESSTKLVLFALENGRVEKLASGSVSGTLLNQFAMDEYKGVFRVVTTVNKWVEKIFTDGVDSYEYEDENYNCLYTLDQSLAQLGKIEKLASDEWVESVRFDGDIGYFVTFRQTDPLFAVDLSDPAKPAVLDTLKLPGFSEYLHVYGEGLLLGLGYEADEDTGMRQGVKLSMFDVSDKTNVKEITTLRLDATNTVVGSNHKAILVDAGRNIIAFPADSDYYIFAYDAAAGFTQLNSVRVGDDLYDGSLRGLFIGNSFYVLSASGLTVFDMSGWDKLVHLDW